MKNITITERNAQHAIACAEFLAKEAGKSARDGEDHLDICDNLRDIVEILRGKDISRDNPNTET
jgi:hypothetical protein